MSIQLPFETKYFELLSIFENRNRNCKKDRSAMLEFFSIHKESYKEIIEIPFLSLTESIHERLNQAGFCEQLQVPSKGYLCEPYLQADLKDSCWSIITPKGESAKTTSPQLLIYTDTTRLEFGTYLGHYSDDDCIRKYMAGLKCINEFDEFRTEFLKRIKSSNFPFLLRCKGKDVYFWLKSGRGIRKDGKILNWDKFLRCEYQHSFPFISISTESAKSLQLSDISKCVSEAFTLIMPIFFAMTYGNDEVKLKKHLSNWLKSEQPKWGKQLGISPYDFSEKVHVKKDGNQYHLISGEWYESSGKKTPMKDAGTYFGILAAEYE